MRIAEQPRRHGGSRLDRLTKQLSNAPPSGSFPLFNCLGACNCAGAMQQPGHRGSVLGPLLAPAEAAGASSESVHGVLHTLRSNYARLFANFLRFNLWVGTWKQSLALLPFLLVGPQLFSVEGAVKVGLLVQLSDAFDHTFNSLAIGMDNWAAVNEFRSVVQRMSEFEATMRAHEGDEHGAAAGTARHERGAGGSSGAASLRQLALI